MTFREFITLAKNDADLLKVLDAEKPEGCAAFIDFARRHGYSIESEELDDAALADVVGGVVPNNPPNAKVGLCWHTGCGGSILHVGNPFRSCVCEKCGETHYWLWSFDYYTT